MRIGIDARSLIFAKAGINRYTRSLIESLAEIDRDNEYILFCNAEILHDCPKYNNVKQKIIRFPNLGKFTEKLWEEVFLPGRLSAEKIDLFHSPRFILPGRKPCKFVVTIHDLALKRMPELVEKKALKHLERQIESGINRADKIIAVSHSTRKDLMELFGVGEDKIEVIYEGIGKCYRPLEKRELPKALRNKHNLPKEFILFVGTIEPRKNLKRLIEAFQRLKKNRSIKHSLVLVGEKAVLCRELFEASRGLILDRDIVFTGYIPESELPFIYNAADLFVYPSLYEGFGLPPLEAMACGVPVITSNVSSLPEVAGEAAILVDPYNVQAITDAMERVLEDNRLKEEMVKKGIERAKAFSWQNTAEKTLKVYTELCGI